MMFVQASERRSSDGSPSFVTVSICRAPLGSSGNALQSFSSDGQGCEETYIDFGKRSMMLRALCI